MDEDDERFEREWAAAQDALRELLRRFLASERSTVRLDQDQAWIALCALDGIGPATCERDELRRRFVAIDLTYAETHDAEAALDAGRVPSRRLEPRADRRRRVRLAQAYVHLTSGSGRATVCSPEWRDRLTHAELRAWAYRSIESLPLVERRATTVDLPLEPARAVRVLADLWGYQKATSCLRALERERDETVATFRLPQAIDL